MKRRLLLSMLGLGPLAATLPPLLRAAPPAGDSAGAAGDLAGNADDFAGTADDFAALEKTDAEWRRILPAERFRILFEEATERAFTSPLYDEKRPGTYICAACQLPLFDAQYKFDSGTGWPSFTQPIAGRIGTSTDFKLIWPRTEYHCARCGGHQGHVFDDGPPPRGERWCNNGLALEFVAQGQRLPELRS
jgi:peptide-methionine (R)-S-oxide reductase